MWSLWQIGYVYISSFHIQASDFFLLRLGYTFNLIGSEKEYKVMKEIEEHFSHPIEEISIEGLSQLEQDQL